MTAFIGFLESLGFDITQKYDHCSDVEIEGIKFGINTGNASFKSRNAYTREEYVRKEQNRFVNLEKGYKSFCAKVYINKEMDAVKIRATIKKAIDEAKAKDKEIEDSQAQDRENTIAIGKHYSECPYVMKFVSEIHIEKSVITFSCGMGSVLLYADGSFKGAGFYFKEVESYSDLDKFDNGRIDLSNTKDLALVLKSFTKLPNNLIEWSAGAYHKRFDVKKQGLSKY